MTNTRWTIENATPRPWRHKTSDGSLGNVVDANGDCIAQTQQRLEDKSKGGHAMRQANAELIAAAVNAYSPSDAEQLSELRRVGQWALDAQVEYNGPCDHEARYADDCLQCQLRAALNPDVPKETQ